MDFSMFEDLPEVQKMLGGMDGMSCPSADRDNKVFPARTPLAMAYVPYQQWGKTYSHDQGLERGTVFPDLDFPFDPKEACDDTER